jgi:replication factor A1
MWLNPWSILQVDPELKEAEAIKEWLGTRMDTAFQAVGTGGKGGAAGPAPRRAMSDIARLGLGLEKTEVFTVRATVMYFRNKEKDGMQTNWQYPSNPENKKKVVQSGDQWVDESTGKVMDACQRRYILGLSACDSTGSSYLTAFDDQAKAMLGKSADELYDMHQVQNLSYIPSLIINAPPPPPFFPSSSSQCHPAPPCPSSPLPLPPLAPPPPCAFNITLGGLVSRA